MTFDITGLLLFLLAIVPGFVAQEAKYSLTPRSLKPKSVLEETGNYVLNSIFIHLTVLAAFFAALYCFQPALLLTTKQTWGQGEVSAWTREHWLLALFYFISSLAWGFLFGLLRGVFALRQPVRNKLLNFSWFNRILNQLGIYSFLEEEPVWYGVFRQDGPGEAIFVQVTMKGNGGFYAGQLERYGILDDSAKDKDFYLVKVSYRATGANKFQKLDAEGILLNFGDVEAIEVMRQGRLSSNQAAGRQNDS